MLITIALASQEGGPASQQLAESLHRSLLSNDTARRNARPQLLRRPPAPGQLGGVTDLIQLLLTDGFSAASLGIAIAQWRLTKSPTISVTVEHNGATVTVEGSDADAVEEAIRRLVSE
ncbi:effector-associated constant component EACC1 [Streptomyces echinatus]|uniref:effector-associated constant component EACC1 n=1 Tax=Streptomyces echinatus TaxID=67293 RepID=UPI0038303291